MSSMVSKNENKDRLSTGRKLIAVLIAVVMAVTLLAYIGQSAEDASAKSRKSVKYWLKVNRVANVVTAYKYTNGKFVPYRAMVCSSGGRNTPRGTYHTLRRYRWKTLMGPVYGQYNTRIHAHYLFHSVWYFNNHNKATVTTQEYNLLGHSRSHGCVRLSVMDAKWIYENCSIGTKVTIYGSRKPGPLGKPKPLKVHGGMAWDPTDPDPRNPDFRLKKPVMRISKHKKHTVQYGSKYNLKSGVHAKNVNAYQDLTDQVKVLKVRKYKNGKWVKARFSTKSLGTYRITYSCRDRYCRGVTKKRFTIRVRDTSRPVISVPKDRTVEFKSTNAVREVTAKVKSGDVNKTMKVTVTKPSGTVKKMSYAEAKEFVFKSQGKYKITYKARSRNSPRKYASKTIYIKCWKDAVIKVSKKDIHVFTTDKRADVRAKIKENTTIKDALKIKSGSKATVKLSKGAPYKEGEEITATIKYKGANGNTVEKEITLKVEAAPDTTDETQP